MFGGRPRSMLFILERCVLGMRVGWVALPVAGRSKQHHSLCERQVCSSTYPSVDAEEWIRLGAFYGAHCLHRTLTRQAAESDRFHPSLSLHQAHKRSTCACAVAIGDHDNVLRFKWATSYNMTPVASPRDVEVSPSRTVSIDILEGEFCLEPGYVTNFVLHRSVQ